LAKIAGRRAARDPGTAWAVLDDAEHLRPLLHAATYRRIFLGTAKALKALHQREIVHPALSPESIQVDPARPDPVLLSNLQSAAILSHGQQVSLRRSSYSAPEAATSPSPPADVYSLAAIILEKDAGWAKQIHALRARELRKCLLRARDPDPARRPTL